jgi:hypothetical protein
MAAKQKRHIRASIVWWILTVIMGLGGIAFLAVGLYIEVTTKLPSGLYNIVVSSFSLALSGIFATMASKLESEERQEIICRNEKK